LYGLTLERLSKPILYSTSIIYLLAALLRYQQIEISDFSVYWASAQSVKSGDSAYISIREDLPYVYGPMLSFLLSFFGGFNYPVAFCLWFIFNSILIFLIVRAACKSIFKDADSSFVGITFSLIAISYPIRHSIAIGQVVTLVLFLSLITYIYREQSIKGIKSWIGAACLVSSFELKPYLAIFVILFLLIDKKLIILIQSFFLILIFNVLYFITLKDSTWINWIHAVRGRSTGLTGDLTQTSLLSLLHNNFSMPDSVELLIYLTSIVIILTTTFYHLAKMPKFYQFLAIISLGPIISPYSHEQDFIFGIFAFITIIVRSKEVVKNRTLLITTFCLFLNLSKPELAKSAFVIGCFLVILYFSRMATSIMEFLIITIWLVVLQFIPLMLVEYIGETRVSQIPKFICLILGYLCWFTTIQFARKSKPLPKSSIR